MEFVEFFNSDRKQYWLEQLELSDWQASKYLLKHIKENDFFNVFAENTQLYLMVEKDKIISHAILTKQDCIKDETLFPWIGFVYTYPKYRGKHYASLLIEHINYQAKKQGYNKIYLATDIENLYERYGFKYLKETIDSFGVKEKIYYKDLKSFSNKYIPVADQEMLNQDKYEANYENRED